MAFSTEKLEVNKITRKEFRLRLSRGTKVALIYSAQGYMDKPRVVERQQSMAVVFWDDDKKQSTWLNHETGESYWEVLGIDWRGLAVSSDENPENIVIAYRTED